MTWTKSTTDRRMIGNASLPHALIPTIQGMLFLCALVTVTLRGNRLVEAQAIAAADTAPDSIEQLLSAAEIERAQEWEEAIARLEAMNAKRVAGGEDVLFVGSSSIRLWDSIETDLAEWRVLRRAYGGARFSDLAVYVDRLLAGHQPRAVVIFVANDIAGDSERDVTPDAVARYARYVAERIRADVPDAEILFVETTPTPSRWPQWDAIAEANGRIQAMTAELEHCHFIPTRADFLNDAGVPDASLFREDRLHLNEAGYQVWSRRISEYLHRHLD